MTNYVAVQLTLPNWQVSWMSITSRKTASTEGPGIALTAMVLILMELLQAPSLSQNSQNSHNNDLSNWNSKQNMGCGIVTQEHGITQSGL